MRTILRWLLPRLALALDWLEQQPSIFTINTYQVNLNNELRKARIRARQAENSLAILKGINDSIVKNAVELKDGEMTPFVFQTVIEIENGMRQIT